MSPRSRQQVDRLNAAYNQLQEERLQRRLSDLSSIRIQRHASAMQPEGLATWKLYDNERPSNFAGKETIAKRGEASALP